MTVGFNRRFAPFTEKLKQFFAGHQEPMVVNIRVNAGYIPQDHWVQRVPSGGGRIVRARLKSRWKPSVAGASPIPFEELVEVSATTIAMEEAIANGKMVLFG